MKKIFFAVFALVMSINANAFEFDGIDLNGNIGDITKQVSAKGYAFDDVKNGLVGNCQGTDILLRFNYENVSQQDVEKAIAWGEQTGYMKTLEEGAEWC